MPTKAPTWRRKPSVAPSLRSKIPSSSKPVMKDRMSKTATDATLLPPARKLLQKTDSASTASSTFSLDESKTDSDNSTDIDQPVQQLAKSFRNSTLKSPHASQVIQSRGEITLLRSSSFPVSQFGVRTCTRTYTMKVKNLAFGKRVLLRGCDSQNKYFEVEARCLHSVGDFEIWQAYLDNLHGLQRYTVNYLVNGVEYEDSNQGQTYDDNDRVGVCLHNGMYVCRWDSGPLTGGDHTILPVRVHVQNLSFHKAVEVWYTCDGWKSTHIAPLSFHETEAFGAGIVHNPNQCGVELWSGELDVGRDVEHVDYAIRFECGGQEYWDNNMGRNYEATTGSG